MHGPTCIFWANLTPFSLKPAAFMGMADRGTLALGKKADVNVIDLPRLNICYPEVSHRR